MYYDSKQIVFVIKAVITNVSTTGEFTEVKVHKCHCILFTASTLIKFSTINLNIFIIYSRDTSSKLCPYPKAKKNVDFICANKIN
jgi:hypothetical protein